MIYGISKNQAVKGESEKRGGGGYKISTMAFSAQDLNDESSVHCPASTSVHSQQHTQLHKQHTHSQHAVRHLCDNMMPVI